MSLAGDIATVRAAIDTERGLYIGKPAFEALDRIEAAVTALERRGWIRRAEMEEELYPREAAVTGPVEIIDAARAVVEDYGEDRGAFHSIAALEAALSTGDDET